MAITKKTLESRPCGVEPYDKEWGVAISAMVDNPSPYPRINKILGLYDKTTDGSLDPERACLVTEAYQKYADQPQPIKCAEAFASVLRNVAIQIYPYELIVGEISCSAKSAPVYPEFSYNWIVDELKNHTIQKSTARTHDCFDVAEETELRLLDLADFWRGKTVEEEVLNRLSEDQLKGSNLGKGVYMLNAFMTGGAGHLGLRYDMLLEQGYGGLKQRVEEKLAKLNPTLPEDLKKREFYQSQLIALEATIGFIKRYAQLAQEMAAAEKDKKRKQELLQIAENCKWVSENPARTFWEALQLFHIATNITFIESNGHSISYGRFDQIFYPFYQKDLKNNTVTKEFIQEMIECFCVKVFELNKVRDKETIGIFANGGIGGPSLTVGGVDKNGQDATNDLTFMMLDAHAHTRIPAPWTAVRLHANSPWELKVKVANVIRIGTGEPKIFNDECTIPAMLAYGRTLEDARDYQVVGCVEPDAGGREYGWHDAAYFSIAKVLELAINDGRCLGCGAVCSRWKVCGELGERLGPQTGSLANFQSFDEVLEAYDQQMKYWVDQLVSSLNVIDRVHQELKPLPYLSLLIEDCIDKGVDVTAGGAKYNFTGPQGVGVGTVGDGLTTIKQLVFEEKKVSGADLLKAVENNWEGYEPLYALVNSEKVHHYGNDDDYADELAKYGVDTYCKHVENKPNAHGGVFVPGVYSVSINVGFGLKQWASVEGRKAFEPISDCMGAVHTVGASHDVLGPTAIVNSVTKLDHVRAGNGTLLNWKFTPTCLDGETGRDNLISLIDIYFGRMGMHSQFTIVDKETLVNAQANPEQYKGLMVRVAGYSAYFVELSVELQNDIIGRTELSFH